MAFCIQCGTDLMVDEARFCPLCGAPQPKLVPRPDEAPAGESGAPAPKPDPRPQLDLPAYPDEDPPAARPPARSRARQASPAEPAQPATPTAETAPSSEEPQAAAPAPLPAQWAAAAQATAAQPPAPAVDTLSYIRRLGRGDHLVVAGTFVLVISLFVTWFDGNVAVRPLGVGSIAGENFIPTQVRTDAFGAGAWHWVLFLLAAALLTYVTARALPGDGIRIPVPHWQLLVLASGVQLGLVLLSVLLPPDIGNWSLTYGGYIGLLAAALAFVGAIDRRREPEVLGERPPHHVWPHLHERQAEDGSPPPAVAAKRAAAADATATMQASAPAPTQQLPSRPLAPPAAAPAGPAAPEAGAPDPRPEAPAPKLASRAATRPPATPAGPATRTSQPAPAPAPLPRGGSLAPRQGGSGRPPARSRPAGEAAPPAETEQRPPARPSSSGAPRTRRAQPQPQPAAAGEATEVTCAICSTPNSLTARVCRTCGVVLKPRPGR